MSEKILEAKLRDSIKRMGGLAVKVWPVSFTGLPDRLVLLPGGKTYFAELKSPGKKPTARQKVVHMALRDIGFVVAVIDSAESLRKFLEDISC